MFYIVGELQLEPQEENRAALITGILQGLMVAEYSFQNTVTAMRTFFE